MPSENKVRLLADDRLGALRGQSLTVGSALVFIPDSGPVEVDASVAEILVAQPGWRYAPAVVRIAASPAPAPTLAPQPDASPPIDVPMPRPQPWAHSKAARRQQRSGRSGPHES